MGALGRNAGASLRDSGYADMSKVAVMRALPARACELICLTPSTCEIACSMGSTISRSTAGGEAPGHPMETEMFG